MSQSADIQFFGFPVSRYPPPPAPSPENCPVTLRVWLPPVWQTQLRPTTPTAPPCPHTYPTRPGSGVRLPTPIRRSPPSLRPAYVPPPEFRPNCYPTTPYPSESPSLTNFWCSVLVRRIISQLDELYRVRKSATNYIGIQVRDRLG